MAQAICLQDWTTIRGNTTGTIVTQQEAGYADLTSFKDVVAFTEVADVSGSININLESSPTRDEGFLTSTATRFPLTVGVSTTIFRYQTALHPVGRYFRWRLSNAAAAWSVTFRVWLACNMSGNFRRMMMHQQRQMAARAAEEARFRRALIAFTEQQANKPGTCACKGAGEKGRCSCGSGS